MSWGKWDEQFAAEYKAYWAARYRCSPENAQARKDYYGRGIKFLFTSFHQFLEHIGPKPTPDHALDRINNDGHYEPGNVRWVTWSESNRNKRSPKRPKGRKHSPETRLKMREGQRARRLREKGSGNSGDRTNPRSGTDEPVSP
jgi:hypothetical protein